jgi:hypothetical protein
VAEVDVPFFADRLEREVLEALKKSSTAPKI